MCHAKCFSLTLCNSMDCNPPGSSVHEILPARTGEWSGFPCPPPGGLPDLGIKSEFHVSCIGSRIFFYL